MDTIREHCAEVARHDEAASAAPWWDMTNADRLARYRASAAPALDATREERG